MDDLPWDNAGLAIFGRSEPDVRPLVKMLLSDQPIPDGVRHMIAKMLDPDGDGYLHFKFELRNLETKRRGMMADLKAMEISADYRAGRAAGRSAEDAAADTGEKYGIDARTVFRKIEQHDEILQFLGRSTAADTK